MLNFEIVVSNRLVLTRPSSLARRRPIMKTGDGFSLVSIKLIARAARGHINTGMGFYPVSNSLDICYYNWQNRVGGK